MLSVKDFNMKLLSLRNTRKLTKTMKMVSATKLRRATEAVKYTDDYADPLRRIVARVARGEDALAHILMRPRLPVRQVLVVMATSEKGLCGGFNNNLFRILHPWMEQRTAEGQATAVSLYGRRGCMMYRNRVTVRHNYQSSGARPEYADAWRVALDVQHDFVSDRVQEVYLAYNRFGSAMSQKPTIERLLPFACVTDPAVADAQADPLVEPDSEALLAAILPQMIGLRIFLALLHSAAGEHGARMTAMDAATTNADKLINETALLRNRARQAAITRELAEIISGSEALKG